jgi:hypothetical protein
VLKLNKIKTDAIIKRRPSTQVGAESFLHFHLSKFFLCIINSAPHHEDVWRSGDIGITPPFLTSGLDVGEWFASRPLPVYPRGKSPQYPFDRRLDGPQSPSGGCGAK